MTVSLATEQNDPDSRAEKSVLQADVKEVLSGLRGASEKDAWLCVEPVNKHQWQYEEYDTHGENLSLKNTKKKNLDNIHHANVPF